MNLPKNTQIWEFDFMDLSEAIDACCYVVASDIFRLLNE
jgi:hypothetical protein